MTAYYNENDPAAAAWLRELIRRGLIAPGEVDDRSILEVAADDVRNFTQTHWFGGIGGWSLALRRAGWADDRPVWTGSAPCQPFSVAGKGLGYDDARHLAPAFLDLVAECRPPVVVGEQVASRAGRDWLADLRARLEGMGYAVGAADLCSAGAGGAHIRQRLYWGAQRLADADRGERRGQPDAERRDERDGAAAGWLEGDRGAAGSGGAGGVEHAHGAGSLAGAGDDPAARHRAPPAAAGDAGGVADANGPVKRRGELRREPQDGGPLRRGDRRAQPDPAGDRPHPRTPDRFWDAADWLLCRDDNWRPVEPGTFPLADALPARVVRLRGYGNAIDPEVAATFIDAFDGAAGERVRLTDVYDLTADDEGVFG